MQKKYSRRDFLIKSGAIIAGLSTSLSALEKTAIAGHSFLGEFHAIPKQEENYKPEKYSNILQTRGEINEFLGRIDGKEGFDIEEKESLPQNKLRGFNYELKSEGIFPKQENTNFIKAIDGCYCRNKSGTNLSISIYQFRDKNVADKIAFLLFTNTLINKKSYAGFFLPDKTISFSSYKETNLKSLIKKVYQNELNQSHIKVVTNKSITEIPNYFSKNIDPKYKVETPEEGIRLWQDLFNKSSLSARQYFKD